MSERLKIWKRIDSKQIADCRVFTVRRDISVEEQTGERADFFVVENPDWVNVIALTGDERVVLIEQYRHGSDDITIEIPGGMIDEDETPERCAARELAEETGYTSDNFVCLGRTRPNPAIQSNWIYHFLATDCRRTAETAFDEHEGIETRLFELDEIEGMITAGKITHSLVLAGFYLLEKHMQKKGYTYES